MEKLNRLIDHTNLKATATSIEIETLCKEARDYNFKTVCVNPAYVSFAKNKLQNSSVLVCTVVGFPLGNNTTTLKVQETIEAIKNGADEIDMVINIAKAKEHDYQYIENEIEAVVKAAKNKVVKVIIETCYLDDNEKIALCRCATKAKAHFVKTSTGFGTGGATVNDVLLMKQNIDQDMEVKASGGIRTTEDAILLINAGATRLGTSGGVAIVTNQKSKEEY